MTRVESKDSIAAEPVLVARQLRKVYQTGEVEVVALADVSLTVAAGEFIVLLGASGSGKSTLLNILGGLDVPTRGTLQFRGQRLDGAGEAALTAYRRAHVGFVFQFYNLIPSLTARENVALVTDIAARPDGRPMRRWRWLAWKTARRSLSVATLSWRRTAARGDCPCRRQATRRAVLRRADRRAGRADRASLVLAGAGPASTARPAPRPAIITHNAATGGMSDRVLQLGDGRLVREERNTHKISPAELQW
jgi:putative ABC transport system ATP-binding protein